MFCPKCGSNLDDNAKFCNSCGTKVVREENTQFQSAPGQVGGAPNQFGAAPGQVGGAPNQFGAAPGQVGGAPNQFGGAPNQFGAAPGQVGGAPNQFGAAPNQFGGTPYQFAGAPAVKKKNLIGLIASAVIMISIFLPFAKITFLGMSKTVSLTDASDWIFFLIVAILGAVFSFFNKNIPLIAAGVIEFIMLLIDSSSFSGEYAELLTKGIGYYLILLASFAMIGAAVKEIVQKKKQV